MRLNTFILQIIPDQIRVLNERRADRMQGTYRARATTTMYPSYPRKDRKSVV